MADHRHEQQVHLEPVEHEQHADHTNRIEQAHLTEQLHSHKAGMHADQNADDDSYPVLEQHHPNGDEAVQGEVVEVEETQLLHDPENDDEMYEEIVGEVTCGENGEYYLVTDDAAPDVDIDGVSKIQVVLNEDGTETVIFQNDGPDHQIQPKQDEYHEDYEMVQVEDGHMGLDSHMYINMSDQDFKQGRRNRVYGQARCPECGQTFINTARLERHLSVHQIFGAFLCQLCGKTYKYEYNLFYHWRKTCRDLNESLTEEVRKEMDVNELREVVENMASKKSDVRCMEFGISSQTLTRNYNGALESRAHMYGKRGVMCKGCGVTVLAAHLPRHLSAHHGNAQVDQPSVGGGYFCDLCGLIFRHRDNLYKHWRTNCSEIQANLPDTPDEIQMDDEDLKQMVRDLLKKMVAGIPAELIRIGGGGATHPNTESERARILDSLTADLNDDLVENPIQMDEEVVAADEPMEEKPMFDQKWIEDHGIIFADDMNDSPSKHRVLTALSQPKWAMNGDMVQCPECFKTFMNIGRLERHMAGYHASTGSHHCVLCGNRFKYDYNLLYHYRRSCPYTKAFIDKDVREQIDSTSLRKLVRNLSQRQPILPSTMQPRLPTQLQTDMVIHKEMLMGPQDNNDASFTDDKVPIAKIAPHNVQPHRQGLPNGYKCPHCEVVFYGQTAIRLHMRMRHQEEFMLKEGDEEVVEVEVEESIDGQVTIKSAEPSRQRSTRKSAQAAAAAIHAHIQDGGEGAVSEQRAETAEQPPELSPEPESEQPAVRPERHGRVLDGQGNDITKTAMVQEMIASGQLEVHDGEDVILVEDPGDIAEGSYFDNQLQFDSMTPSTSREQHHPAGVDLASPARSTRSRTRAHSNNYPDEQYRQEEIESYATPHNKHGMHKVVVAQEDNQQWLTPNTVERRSPRKRKAETDVPEASSSTSKRFAPAILSPSRRSQRQRTVSRT